MLSMASQSSNVTKSEPTGPFVPTAAGDSPATSAAATAVKMEPSDELPFGQDSSTQQVASYMGDLGTAAGLGTNQEYKAQAPPPAAHMANVLGAAATPVVPTNPHQLSGFIPQMMQQIPSKQAQQIPSMFPTAQSPVPQHTVKSTPNAPTTSAVGAAPGTIRNGNGGGGQLLQFPWKLHEMLHLAEKNSKTCIISWLPGGNGFKVHNKEKFCAEIMPGYFASQKYKTFQRSLNLWGFESVAKGPDRGACYHQYFVKGHPELCHSMTRVKIKGQSHPRPLLRGPLCRLP